MDPYTLYLNPFYVAVQRNQVDQVSKHYYYNGQRFATKTGFYLAPISPPSGMSSMGNNTMAKNLEATIAELGFTDSLSWSTQSASAPDTNVAHYPRLMYYYHPDYLGHVEYITDLDGLPYQRFYYTAWGETLIEEKATRPGMNFDSPYRFNGKELDEETGLYYYGARYYNPTVSVWLGVDLLAHKYPNMTSYVFTGNNPVMLVDPDGKQIRANGGDAQLAMRSLITKYTGGDLEKAKKLYNLSPSSLQNNLYSSRDFDADKKIFAKRAKKFGLTKNEIKEAYVLYQAIVSKEEEIQIEIIKVESGPASVTQPNVDAATNYEGTSSLVNGNDGLEQVRQDIIEQGGCTQDIIDNAVRPQEGAGTGPYKPDAIGQDYSIYKGVPNRASSTQIKGTILIDGSGKNQYQNASKIMEALTDDL
jgi:RHS repeat-associated protein